MVRTASHSFFSKRDGIGFSFSREVSKSEMRAAASLGAAAEALPVTKSIPARDPAVLIISLRRLVVSSGL